MAKRHSPSEVHAYSHILVELLGKKGWNKKQIFTQQECLTIKLIADALGQTHPENIVQLGETSYYVIEAKNERAKVDLALKEAREDYADLINRSKVIKAPFITGIAGNSDEGFIAASQFFKDGKWLTITENDIEITWLLSRAQIDRILAEHTPNLRDVEIDEKEFLKAAEEINGFLHEGGVHKDIRARVIAAILLALKEGTDINLDEAPAVLIDSINSRVDLVLKRAKKPEFCSYVHIEKPSSEDNHNKLKKALVLTIQELLELNIRSAMKSGKDVLGRFYEVFLKYGNGAKEIGIVLTPRHITQFAAEALDVQASDLVLDPTCGTGGFLVAAFDEVKRKTEPSDDWEKFKNWGLYGIEEQDFIVSLALVNMIFRGDGKNNVIGGDCFAKWLTAKTHNGDVFAEYLSSDSTKRIPPITKVLMNPPFPKKKTDYKPYLFIEHALKQMQNDGVLFSILPYSCMIKRGGYLAWRKRLLKENTLLSVITFPEDLFYPVGVHTIGVFIRKGVSHGASRSVLWFRALNDGRLKKKGKRLEHPKARNDYPTILQIIKRFISGERIKVVSIPAFQKLCEIDWSDEDLELVPEAYLDEPPINPSEVADNIDQLMREGIAFRIQFEKQLKELQKNKK